MIEATPTMYRGTRCRSVLEAQHAMRFDRLGIEVVYEPDKVFLAPKWSYVPDFFVKPWSAYVEIKPLSPTQDARKKAALLARKTHALVHVFAGQESIQIWG